MAQFFSQMFQVGGNHEMWHKDTFKGGEFKLIRRHVKSDLGTVSWDSCFFVHMFTCNDENVKFFSLQGHCMSYTNRKTTRT